MKRSKQRKPCKLLSAALVLPVTLFSLVGCAQEVQPDFSGYKHIAELATLDCSFHNVAEIYNDGTDVLFGINVGYKKAWFEYDGRIRLGVDVSKVRIEGPDADGVVSITVPDAQVLGEPDIDDSTFSDIYQDTGLFTQVELADEQQALQAAQEEMISSAENDPELMARAKERAEMLLEQYVVTVGRACGKEYTPKIVGAE